MTNSLSTISFILLIIELNSDIENEGEVYERTKEQEFARDDDSLFQLEEVGEGDQFKAVHYFLYFSFKK